MFVSFSRTYRPSTAIDLHTVTKLVIEQQCFSYSFRLLTLRY